jgi:hypothetical protein
LDFFSNFPNLSSQSEVLGLTASNKNEYQKSWLDGKARPELKADTLTLICVPGV